jgi:flagellar basal body-associated protein FliL
MAETEPKPSPAINTKPDEISLDEIDRILKEDDPDFTNQLGEIQSVSGDSEVDIESLVPGDDETMPIDEVLSVGSRLLDRFPKLEKILKPLGKVRSALYTRWLRTRANAVVLFHQLWIYARTWPGEFAQYLKAMSKIAKAQMGQAQDHFKALPRLQKLAWLTLSALALSFVLVLKLNLMGVWLPGLFPHVVSDLTTVADKVWTVEKNEEWVGLYRAFPQEEIEFLFPKIIVNLRRTRGYSNPMGAFELYVVMDSKDAALEVQARQKELHDLLQRAIEDQSYPDLGSPLGKKRIKDLLRRELNDVLTQGWVKDILIKTMVLKP